MDEKTAYNIVKTIFDQASADLIRGGPQRSAENFKLENQSKASATPVPVPPGRASSTSQKKASSFN